MLIEVMPTCIRRIQYSEYNVFPLPRNMGEYHNSDESGNDSFYNSRFGESGNPDFSNSMQHVAMQLLPCRRMLVDQRSEEEILNKKLPQLFHGCGFRRRALPLITSKLCKKIALENFWQLKLTSVDDRLESHY